MKNLEVSFMTRKGLKKTFVVSNEVVKKPRATVVKTPKVNYDIKRRDIASRTNATSKKSGQPTRSSTASSGESKQRTKRETAGGLGREGSEKL